ncbi:undecaprenyldiphospho-muramoylpentapeptide beta-N-acetylglucosaminyltransferase [Candidatus Shapirobacteria bacterium CG09_land_8_20_14_0_10_38_17]|uniref:UDP-N-acetylglucosamine--N-acetylmuramyl-(pentapeptide) pyrophosphoryl-undecaprenol N-acetylglucosamine transferase n=1 Tax=Candidatus Shapirobacteria bacterium CG09_land_8_20_14_0_10_38_17 TaxID=1974884 RepID=A0A2H0WQQ2_9BACT|nr:MAG: undecaprenyldiphospho-muramoylpentapeptide beta-N-acetylglucosaminyltransferase [Candidatus Shapirobacteria bacterium CG09_land_8_20_14_0_10_38_17]
MKRIIITGAHLTPALAIISELKERGNWQIYYLGRKYTLEGDKTPSAESQVLPQVGIKFIPIPAGRLQRKFTRWTIPSLIRIPLGVIHSFWHLLKIRPDLVCSFGGYVSVPIVFAAWLLGIPSLTHEQTVVVGLANKINALFANKVAISFSDSAQFFPKKKVILTGNPLRQEIFKIGKPLFSLPKNRKTIYITGGSQGASVINQAVLEALPELIKNYNIIHQCGNKEFPKIARKRKSLPVKWQQYYFLTGYVDPKDIGWVFKNAHLVISRGGANTILELAALGKPAIIIPIPWATHNEQMKNAKFLSDKGLAEILGQSKLNGQTLTQKIQKMNAHLNNYQKAGEKIKKEINRQSSQSLVNALYDLLPS